MPAPAHSRGARTYGCQNQGALRSDARPTSPRQAHNSVRVALAISWRPTPPAATSLPKKLFYSFPSSVASSGDDSACRSSNPDSGKTRCVACRCPQTPQLAAEFPRGCVGGSPTFSVSHSSSHFTTHASHRKGALPRRLRCSALFARALMSSCHSLGFGGACFSRASAASLHVRCFGRAVGGETVAHKKLVCNDGPYGGQKISGDIRFQNVTPSAGAQSLLHNVPTTVLAYEQYSRGGNDLADLPSGFDAVELGKTDIQQNQVREQLSGLLDCF